jgi:hypothetical protein
VKSKFLALVASIAIALGLGLTIGASPALAGGHDIPAGMQLNLATGVLSVADSYPQDPCGLTNLCFYDCANSGCGKWETYGNGNYACRQMGVDRLGNSMNNRTSIIVNNSLRAFRVWDYTTCGQYSGDTSAYINPQSWGDMNSTWNNRIGSVKELA